MSKIISISAIGEGIDLKIYTLNADGEVHVNYMDWIGNGLKIEWKKDLIKMKP